MEDGTLKKYFEDLTEKIEDIKTTIKEIKEKQSSQYKKIIEHGLEIKHNKENLDEYKKSEKENLEGIKDDNKDDKDHLWDELRRRDRKVMWIIGLAVPFVSVIIIIISGYLGIK